jgi:hypothetical protein
MANKKNPKPKAAARCALVMRSIGTSGGAAGSVGGASPVIGQPQSGQATALSLTQLRHSGQTTITIGQDRQTSPVCVRLCSA